MEIHSYTFWKQGQGKWSSSNLIGSEDVLFIFLRAFSDIERTFFETGSLNFKPKQEHFQFLEHEIKAKIESAEKTAIWKSEWPKDKIEFIRRGGHIHNVKFQDMELEINTFGQHENYQLLDFISLYDTFMDAKDGLKITTEWIFNKNS